MDPKTIRKHLLGTAIEVESLFADKVISRRSRGEKFVFGLCLDLWDDWNGTKDLGAFLIEPNVLVPAEPETFLLCMTPLLDKTTSNGDAQIATIELALGRLNLTMDDVVFLVADNTNVNPFICRKLNKPLIGSKSHVLGLAIKELLSPFLSNKDAEPKDKLLDKVNRLCK